MDKSVQRVLAPLSASSQRIAASFVAPNEAQVAGLQSAALWLGFALALGSGAQDFAQVGTEFFKEINALLGGGGPEGQGPADWMDPFDFDNKKD